MLWHVSGVVQHSKNIYVNPDDPEENDVSWVVHPAVFRARSKVPGDDAVAEVRPRVATGS